MSVCVIWIYSKLCITLFSGMIHSTQLVIRCGCQELPDSGSLVQEDVGQGVWVRHGETFHEGSFRCRGAENFPVYLWYDGRNMKKWCSLFSIQHHTTISHLEYLGVTWVVYDYQTNVVILRPCRCPSEETGGATPSAASAPCRKSLRAMTSGDS